MNKLIRASFFAALLLAGAGCQSTTAAAPKGHVVVNYDHPEKFTDFKYSRGGGTEPGFLDSLRDFLVAEGGKYLPADQTLTLTFTDIDMAGEIGMNPRAGDTRVIRSSFPVRIDFSYMITDAAGLVVKEGKEELVNNFPSTQMGLNRNDPLFHEKEEMSDWMRHTLK